MTLLREIIDTGEGLVSLRLCKMIRFHQPYYYVEVCPCDTLGSLTDWNLEVYSFLDSTEHMSCFGDLYEKYRIKRNRNNKDGQVVRLLREKGIKACVKQDERTGIRSGIVYWTNGD